jgi:acetyl esterase
MPTTLRTAGRTLRAILVLGIGAALLAGCVPTGSDSETVTADSDPLYRELETYPEIPVVENVQYGTADGVPLLLDVCLPEVNTNDPDALKPRAAILSIHGGSWAYGDKASANWRSVCQWLASEGYVAASVNYRLAPGSVYPAAIQDVRQAVRWLRADSQVEEYTIDPERIGAFGGSAGGNLAALLGVGGAGPHSLGSRVAAVAELSGPVDLTDEGRELGGLVESFEQIQLDYLGCEALVDCSSATAASPLYRVDPTDPPFFVGHSIDERIPIEQSEAFVEELRDNEIDTTFVTVEGARHSIAMLDADMRDRVAEFFEDHLSDEDDVLGVVP